MKPRFSGRVFVTISISIVFLYATLPQIYTNSLEDEYVEHFGNDPLDFKGWAIAKNWYYEDQEPMLRKYCEEVHKQAGKGSCTVDYVLLKNRVLQFKNPNYYKRRVDVVEYSPYEENTTTETTISWKWKEFGEKWQITEGTRPDCVYYLNLDDPSLLIFSLKERVCGITFVDDRIKDY